MALLGAAARTLIAPTTDDDFLAAVRTYMREILGRTEMSAVPGGRPYAVLTSCRALNAHYHAGRQASKKRAASSACDRYPSWSKLIRGALARRSGESTDGPGGDGARSNGLAFVRFAAAELERTAPDGDDL